MTRLLPSLLVASLFGCLSVSAEPWRVWDTEVGTPFESEIQIMDDGSILTLHHDVIELGTPADRILLLQSFDPVAGEITTLPITYIGTEAVNFTSFHVRLAGNGSECWAVWRTQDSSGGNSLKATKVYPNAGSFAVETITTDNAWQRFDACLGHDGLPRVIFVRDDLGDALVARRLPDGTWEQSSSVLLPPNTIVQDVALASLGDRLDLFVCTGENRSLNSGLPGFRSVLSKFHVIEPEDWDELLTSTQGHQTWDEAIFLTSNDPVADRIRAEWTADDRLAATYTNRSTQAAVLAHWKAGILETQDFYTTLGAIVRETGLAPAPDGSIYVCYSPDGDGAAYRVWKDGSFGPPEVISELADIRDFGIDVNRQGHLWFAGVQPGSFPAPKFQIAVALDYTDEDHDGYPYLLEDALHTDPDVPDFEGRPIFEVFSTGGQEYLSLAYLGDSGGTGNNPYITANFEYHVEISDDAMIWTSDGSRVVLEDRFTITGRGTVNRVRSTSPIASRPREFIRIRVLRR